MQKCTYLHPVSLTVFLQFTQKVSLGPVYQVRRTLPILYQVRRTLSVLLQMRRTYVRSFAMSERHFWCFKDTFGRLSDHKYTFGSSSGPSVGRSSVRSEIHFRFFIRFGSLTVVRAACEVLKYKSKF